jgi:hypothetical protein
MVCQGKKFPGIREHMQKCIGDVYGGMDLTCETFPADDQVDPAAYKPAVQDFAPGDVAIIVSFPSATIIDATAVYFASLILLTRISIPVYSGRHAF